MFRLFVAIDPPEKVQKVIARLAYGLPGARWVETEQLHLTLRFIGEVDGGELRDIDIALGRIRAKSFDLAVKGVGHFPPRGDPKVLWVGMEKCEPLFGLQRNVDSALRGIGPKPEKRKFHPHITLARLRNTPLARMHNYLAEHGFFRVDSFSVNEFHLYSSTLTPKGPIHRKEATYPLL